MHPLVKLTIRLLLIFVVIYVIIQPFNWFCQITQTCRPFFLSYYIPKTRGENPINISFVITNYSEKVDFKVSQPSLTTYGNVKNTITYYAKNLTNKTIYIYPSFFVEPDYTEKYIIRYECLCSHRYKIKPLETIEMKMEFEINNNIIKDKSYIDNQVIKLRYKI